MTEPYRMPIVQEPFSFVDAVVGVFVRPVVTMQKIAAARPWGIALGIMIMLAVLGLLAGLTVPTQPVTTMPETEGMPPSMATMVAMSQSRIPAIIGGVAGPLLQIVYAGILFVLARLLRGEGHFSALFSTLVFAGLPGVITLVLTLIANVSGIIVLSLIIGMVSFGIGIWSLVLQVIGVRESMHLSTGRAVTTGLIPVAVLLFLACALLGVFFVLIARVMSSA